MSDYIPQNGGCLRFTSNVIVLYKCCFAVLVGNYQTNKILYLYGVIVSIPIKSYFRIEMHRTCAFKQLYGYMGFVVERLNVKNDMTPFLRRALFILSWKLIRWLTILLESIIPNKYNKPWLMIY